MKKKIVILGSTGSIGTQAIEVVEANPDRFEVVGISAAGSNPNLVVQQARALRLSAEQVAVAKPEAARQVSQELGGTVLSGEEAARLLVDKHRADTVLNGLVGSMGLAATLATLKTGVTLALANKESLVAGGTFVTSQAQPGQIVPVDSEHSAMAQCLRAGRADEVARYVLTASGGPFRGQTREQMWDVTPEQAAAHPTWSMGQMNTLNSATMVNKGLELIEATLLFNVAPELIDVTVHPQSIIHSAVTFVDGSTIAQASPPSMKLPISHALAWPRRVADAQPALDFSQSHDWRFEPLDDEAFPAVQLARDVATQGGTFPAVYNAANEEAAAAFLGGRIRFPQIVDVVAEIVGGAADFAVPATSFEDVVTVEDEARRRANALIDEIAD
ncbi:1-deoxy-D-xylulose-5-phosphate reductoisomerase [Corynebacterium cystitidis]|uniref:1-deoxy-D-xylulose 5-phosphate reductoisomerase n=1 Tax=Corynebacterium cystitidis DSM 20524 TaxID=1121357 RepID=A0A1H9NYN2_9CORY|nr:1-deoxy-D-xylulose-5-phosphate reductoisomerase [Corynebacterium cystitidis]WJY82678.1 1-deoxy-D-xylulose 5-phosphate reductoisomerase [Corynebacterium cystitidis DSM 20524]SER41042.1 1-deoxy-D-xylulose 5-phosphate reductoisomerase [Corynebacterium cystitidis DSM 20524]SNV71922.1 1-deoxy-D-xylulose 5-phosphate reductoisomerase [Corynebacterium cystitidis]